MPDAFGLGGEGAIADSLAALVLAGRKRATASLPLQYTSVGQSPPKAGDLSIIVDGRGAPTAIIERTDVEVVPFHAVSPAFAALEGEGDGSLAHWRSVHADYFSRVLAPLGRRLGADSLVLCQRFRLVWPPSLPGRSSTG